MFETINESVKVLVSFDKNMVKPLAFYWANKKYEIEKVNLIHEARRGDHKIYFFSVSDSVNFYRLSFDTKTLEWNLEEMYSDG